MLKTLTSTARLGVSIMADLATRSAAGPVALASISTRQAISLSYLQQIVAGLRRQGLVRPVRGPGGGYLLGRAAHEISMADIVEAVASDEAPEWRNTTAGRGGDADMWARLHTRLFECLSAISLHDLIREAREHQPSLPASMPREKTIRHGISSEPVLMPIRPTSLNSVFALGTTGLAQPAPGRLV